VDPATFHLLPRSRPDCWFRPRAKHRVVPRLGKHMCTLRMRVPRLPRARGEHAR
jgi:hypothetical protein